LDRLEALNAQLGGHLNGAHAVPVDAGSPEVGDLNLGDLTARLSYPLGIMVNQDAQRFIDEGMDFKSYSLHCHGSGDFAPTWRQRLPDLRPADRRTPGSPLRLRQPSCIAETIGALAEKLGLNPEALVRTVNAYNDAIQEGTFNPAIKDASALRDRTGQNQLALRLDQPPFVAYGVRCGITFTYGGVMVNDAAEVLRHRWHTHPRPVRCRRDHRRHFLSQLSSGSGLMLGAVFGRIAGTKAAAFVRRT